MLLPVAVLKIQVTHQLKM
jgi:hypothetical protein